LTFEDITVSFVNLVAVLCAVGLTGLGVYCIWQSSDWAIDRKLRRYHRTKIHQDLDRLEPDNPRYWSRLLDLNDVEK